MKLRVVLILSGGVAAVCSLASCATQPAAPIAGSAVRPSGGQSPQGSPLPSPSPSCSHAAPGKCYFVGTGHLQITISPARGPVGTVVTIAGTGCGDPDGQNHAVSFNPDEATSSRGSGDVRDIASTLSGQTITASYTISARDAEVAGASYQPEFSVQCTTDVAQTAYTITR